MYNLYKTFRLVLYPFLKISSLFFKKLRQRFNFENIEYIGFKGQSADYCFEVSSEGELEQVYHLIEKCLKEKKKVELIYCSPSVKNNCYNIAKKYPSQINLISMPLVSYIPFSSNEVSKWISAKTVFLCRYDFFPELLFGLDDKAEFILISGSLKNYDKKPKFVKLYLKNCYQKFSKIVMASELEKKRFSDLGISFDKLISFDFRAPRVLHRLNHSDDTLSKKGEAFYYLANYFKSFKEQKYIFGSMWPVDSFLLDEIESRHLYCIAPHNIDDDSVYELVDKIEQRMFLVHDQSTLDEVKQMISDFENGGGIWILQIKGVLCELYTLFDKAYIGGGFGKSVHSLLEPYLAGCEVYCGPKVFRSSEYDLIKSKDENKINILTKDNFEKIFISQFKNTKQSYTLEEDLSYVEQWPFSRS